MGSSRLWKIMGVVLSVFVLIHISEKSSGQDAPSQAKLLQSVVDLTERNHYHVLHIDDDFSRALWKKYIDVLDPLKSLFLQRDIDSLRQFETVLDDEMKGTRPWKFFPYICQLYAKRLQEANAMDGEILNSALTYEENVLIYPNGRSTEEFARSKADLYRIRRNMLKYLNLQQMMTLKQSDKTSGGNGSADLLFYRDRALTASKDWIKRAFETYYASADTAQQFGYYVNNILQLIDPHTNYFMPSEQKAYQQKMTGGGANGNSNLKTGMVNHQGHRLGYIAFSLFYSDEKDTGGGCSKDIAAALSTMKADHVEGVVFDLRNNSGGSLREVLGLLSRLLPKGPLVQVKTRDQPAVTLETVDGAVFFDMPLVVLVNGKTASAAEVFTAAIQDYQRGLVIGSQTYGKGTVQRSFPLDNNQGLLKITFEQFFRINGNSTQRRGVTPDIDLVDLYKGQKVRERDYNNSLAWASTAPANFQYWKDRSALQPVKNKMGALAERDGIWKEISGCVDSLAMLTHEKVNLNHREFYAKKMELLALSFKMQRLMRVKNGDELAMVPSSMPETDPSSDSWVATISKDLYANYAISLLKEIVDR